MAGLQVLNPRTLRIRLRKPDAGFLYALASTTTAVLPKEWVARWGDVVGRHPLGSGPYVVSSWSPGREIKLAANPNTPAESAGAAAGIRCVYTLGAGDAVAALQRGEVDLLGEAIPQARLTDIRKSHTWRERLVEAPRLDLCYVYLNTLVAPFNDLRVRHAVSHAIDTAALEERLSFRVSALGQVFPAGMPGHTPGGRSYAHDAEQARELLASAGYPDGFTTTLYTHDADPMPTVAKAVKKDLAAVGITVDIAKIDRAQYWAMASQKDSGFGIGLADWAADSPTPQPGSAPSSHGRKAAEPTSASTATRRWRGSRGRRRPAAPREAPRPLPTDAGVHHA